MLINAYYSSVTLIMDESKGMTHLPALRLPCTVFKSKKR